MVINAMAMTTMLTKNEAQAMTIATVALSRMPTMLSAAKTPTPVQASKTIWASNAGKALPTY